MNYRRPTLEQLLAGEVMVCLLNEPIDFVVDGEPKVETAREIADRRWHMTSESGNQRE